jgi:hypothetical protein
VGHPAADFGALRSGSTASQWQQSESVTSMMKRYRHDKIPPIDSIGVYIFWLVGIKDLGPIRVGPSGLLYIGMTESSLKVRNHFSHEDSSFSTFRRSLGAVLKHDRGLSAVHRGKGLSSKDFTHYRFAGIGEKQLTLWMKENLEYSYEVVSVGVRSRESQLIAEMKPPLNLTKWPNPQRRLLMELRGICRDEAAHSVAMRS